MVNLHEWHCVVSVLPLCERLVVGYRLVWLRLVSSNDFHCSSRRHRRRLHRRHLFREKIFPARTTHANVPV